MNILVYVTAHLQYYVLLDDRVTIFCWCYIPVLAAINNQ